MQLRWFAGSVRTLFQKTGHTSMKIRRWKFRQPTGQQYASQVCAVVLAESAFARCRRTIGNK